MGASNSLGRCLCQALHARTPRSSSGCWMATSNSSTPYYNWFHCWCTDCSLHCVPEANTSFKLLTSTAKMTSSNGFSWLFSVSDLALYYQHIQVFKGEICKITYLNCTLTVSSNKHVGLLRKKKKKRHYQNVPLLFYPPLIFGWSSREEDIFILNIRSI